MTQSIPFASIEEFRDEAVQLTKQLKNIKLSSIKEAISSRYGFSDTRAFEKFIASNSVTPNLFLENATHPYALCNADGTISLFKKVPTTTYCEPEHLCREDILHALANALAHQRYNPKEIGDTESTLVNLESIASSGGASIKATSIESNKDQMLIEIAFDMKKDIDENQSWIRIILNDNQHTSYSYVFDEAKNKLSSSKCPLHALFSIIFDRVETYLYWGIKENDAIDEMHEVACAEILKKWEASGVEKTHPFFSLYLAKHGSSIELIRDMYYQTLSFLSLSAIKEQEENEKTLIDNIGEVLDNTSYTLYGKAFARVLASIQLTYVQ